MKIARISIPIVASLLFCISCTTKAPEPTFIIKNKPENQLSGVGTVRRIIDGDSIDITFNGESLNVRLACIDAMEKDAPGGKESTSVLEALVPIKSKLEIKVVDIDLYGRLIVEAYLDKELINAKMVQNGAAVVYKKYLSNCKGHEDNLLSLENEAKINGLGFWGLPKPQQIKPWDWRKMQK